MEKKGVDSISELLEKWMNEAGKIGEEIKILRRADEIIGDGSVRHGIDLWEMKLIRLQRCIAELQNAKIINGWIRVPGYERFTPEETPNAEITGRQKRSF